MKFSRRCSIGWAQSLVIALAVTACANPSIVNFVDAPVRASRSEVGEDDVRTAIVHAAESLGWSVRAGTLRNLVAARSAGNKSAVVDIDYTSMKYSIKYRDSNNLSYKSRPIADRAGTIVQLSVAQGQIDGRYNEWVQEVDRVVRRELAELTQ